MADMHEATFSWPDVDADTVIVTGTFDQWSRSVHLDKTPRGFEGRVKLPWGRRILYKFVVNGQWVTASSQPEERDAAGNINNVYECPSKPEPSIFLAPEPVETKHNDIQESSDPSPPSETVSAEQDTPNEGTSRDTQQINVDVTTTVSDVVPENAFSVLNQAHAALTSAVTTAAQNNIHDPLGFTEQVRDNLSTAAVDTVQELPQTTGVTVVRAYDAIDSATTVQDIQEAVTEKFPEETQANAGSEPGFGPDSGALTSNLGAEIHTAAVVDPLLDDVSTSTPPPMQDEHSFEGLSMEPISGTPPLPVTGPKSSGADMDTVSATRPMLPATQTFVPAVMDEMTPDTSIPQSNAIVAAAEVFTSFEPGSGSPEELSDNAVGDSGNLSPSDSISVGGMPTKPKSIIDGEPSTISEDFGQPLTATGEDPDIPKTEGLQAGRKELSVIAPTTTGDIDILTTQQMETIEIVAPAAVGHLSPSQNISFGETPTKPTPIIDGEPSTISGDHGQPLTATGADIPKTEGLQAGAKEMDVAAPTTTGDIDIPTTHQITFVEIAAPAVAITEVEPLPAEAKASNGINHTEGTQETTGIDNEVAVPIPVMTPVDTSDSTVITLSNAAVSAVDNTKLPGEKTTNGDYPSVASDTKEPTINTQAFPTSSTNNSSIPSKSGSVRNKRISFFGKMKQIFAFDNNAKNKNS